MKEYIERRDAIVAVRLLEPCGIEKREIDLDRREDYGFWKSYLGFDNGIKMAIIELEQCKAARVREDVRGKWLKRDESICYCSVCDGNSHVNYDESIEWMKFCPYCGARMEADK